MGYKVGQKLRFTGNLVKGSPNIWTFGKVYMIQSCTGYCSFLGAEYTIVRDDGQVGLWWDKELDEHFITLKEERKLKIKKINENIPCGA